MFGLPLHPLVVHAAVVLVPLAFVAMIAAAVTNRWKGAIALSVAALAVAGAVFAVLAASSGEELEEEVEDRAEAVGVDPRFHDHPEQGDTAEALAIAFAVAAVIVVVVPYAWKRAGEDRRIQAALLGVAVLIGAGATWTMVAAGHSGAQLVWKDTGNFVTGQQGDPGGDLEQDNEREDDD